MDKKWKLRDIQWLEDEYGVYWAATLLDADDVVKGVTGSYYDILGDLRPSKELQECDIADNYEVVLGV